MKKQLLALVVAAIAFTASDALAQTTVTTNVVVSARVDPACTISAAPLAFGTYDPLTGTAVPTTGDLTLTCTKRTFYTVRLGPGTGNSGSFPRAMTGTNLGGALGYDIYTDSNHTIMWGDGTTGVEVTGTAADKNAFALTMYGLITANQDPNQDVYGDTVVASVTF